jgi:hypothetical protein
MLARLIILLTVVFAALIAGAPISVAEPPAPPAPIIPPPVQPANIGDLKFEARHYYDSGAYLTDLQLTSAAIPRGSASRTRGTANNVADTPDAGRPCVIGMAPELHRSKPKRANDLRKQPTGWSASCWASPPARSQNRCG